VWVELDYQERLSSVKLLIYTSREKIVFYGYKTWSYNIKEEHRLQNSQDKVFRIKLGYWAGEENEWFRPEIT
jgi:hypothetical protein